jgi:hypothetical protein
MARSRVNYSSGFKDEAVRLVIEASRPIADVARELSVHEGTSGVLGKAAAFFAQEYRRPRGTSSSTRRRRATPITGMCAWTGVGRAGFYEWVSRPVSATASRREELKVLVAHVFTDSDGT